MIESFDENCLVTNCLKMEPRFRHQGKHEMPSSITVEAGVWAGTSHEPPPSIMLSKEFYTTTRVAACKTRRRRDLVAFTLSLEITTSHAEM